MDKLIIYVDYEVGYRPRSHWERKYFDARWKAVKFADEWRWNHSGGACVTCKWG